MVHKRCINLQGKHLFGARSNTAWVLNTVTAAEMLHAVVPVSSKHKERNIGLYASARLGLNWIRK